RAACPFIPEQDVSLELVVHVSEIEHELQPEMLSKLNTERHSGTEQNGMSEILEAGRGDVQFRIVHSELASQLELHLLPAPQCEARAHVHTAGVDLNVPAACPFAGELNVDRTDDIRP